MATTVSQTIPTVPGLLISVPVAASTKILQGSIVARNASGYLVPASDTANLVVLGIAEDEVDNTAGGNGDLVCPVARHRAFKLKNDGTAPMTIAHVGTAGAACVKDNDTVQTAAGATNDIPVGMVLAVDADGVWVFIG